jgi:hypothetical protein
MTTSQIKVVTYIYLIISNHTIFAITYMLYWNYFDIFPFCNSHTSFEKYVDFFLSFCSIAFTWIMITMFCSDLWKILPVMILFVW